MAGNGARKLILEDGSVYFGRGFGAETERVLEVVFNTSMAGYEEILSDRSYTDQAVVMTYPLIGNYGVNAADAESESPTVGGLIVGEYNPCRPTSAVRAICPIGCAAMGFRVLKDWTPGCLPEASGSTEAAEAF